MIWIIQTLNNRTKPNIFHSTCTLVKSKLHRYAVKGLKLYVQLICLRFPLSCQLKRTNRNKCAVKSRSDKSEYFFIYLYRILSVPVLFLFIGFTLTVGGRTEPVDRWKVSTDRRLDKTNPVANWADAMAARSFAFLSGTINCTFLAIEPALYLFIVPRHLSPNTTSNFSWELAPSRQPINFCPTSPS